jgi:threonine synthase
MQDDLKAGRWPLVCGSCGVPYPEQGLPYRCPVCGGLFELEVPLKYDPVDTPGRVGMARYRRSFPLPAQAELPSLGEGGTPLLAIETLERRVFFKCEHLNPSGSFKDRGTLILVAALLAAGVGEAIEDSSGNAGASFAAYAARAGIKARVFTPDYAAGAKRAQIEAYGAELVRVMGPRSNASEAVARAAQAGAVYASHAYLPQGLAGMATIAFEIVEALDQSPGAFLCPVGQGSLLLGAWYGFQALKVAGVIEEMPRMIGVQARACAPLWAVHTSGAAGLSWTQEGATIAEGIRILHPQRGDAVLQAVESSGGRFLAVEEDEIVQGRQALGRLGLFVEPTSAVVWPALQASLRELPDPVVVILTGSGLKDPEN